MVELEGWSGGQRPEGWAAGGHDGVATDALRPGLHTGIGPLAHVDPLEAVQFLLRRQPQLPAAPELPRRSPAEGRVARALHGVPGVQVRTDGSLTVDVEAVDRALAAGDPFDDVDVDGDGWLGLRVFLDEIRGRAEPVKLQVPGPVTVAVALHAQGVSSPSAIEVATRSVQARARRLIHAARASVPSAALLVVVDEPGLAGSMHPVFPFGGADITASLAAVLDVLRPHAAVGVHCDHRADWPAILRSRPDLLSAPVDGRLETATDELAAFLQGGGWVAWGAVPVHEPIGTVGEALWKRLSWLWCELVREGCDPVLLRTQALVTPSSGLDGHGISQSDRAMELCRRISDRIHDQAVGVRLSVGA